MADFNISGRQKVKTLKANFKKEFGSTLRIYNGARFADDDSTIASIASIKIASDAEVKANGNLKVGSFNKKMVDIFGIKVRVSTPDDASLCADDITLSASGKAK